MKVYLERQDKNVTIKFAGTAARLLKRFKLNPQEVLVSRNGTLVTEKEKLKDSDNVTLLSVISGG
jgi:sulfur carrier protein ThiS